MAIKQFNPLEYGAVPVNDGFDPIALGAKPVVEEPAKRPGLFSLNTLKGETTYEAERGGAGTILPNVARTFGNIPSSATMLTRAVTSPVNPLDTESPINIGGNVARSVDVARDIFKDRGAKEGTKDILKGTAEVAGKIFKAPGEFLVKQSEKKAEKPQVEQRLKTRDELTTLITQKRQRGEDVSRETAALRDLVAVGDEAPVSGGAELVSKIAELGIEDPLLIPSLLYAPTAAKRPDIITKIAGPVTRGADTSLKALMPKTKAVVSGIKASRTNKAIDKLEDSYLDIMRGRQQTRNASQKAERVTQLKNKSGTVGRTPERVLAENGIVPEHQGTEFTTRAQAGELMEKVRPLSEANKAALREAQLSTAPISIDDFERAAILKAKSPANLAAGDADAIADKISREMALYRKNFGDRIALDTLDDIKSARWKKTGFSLTRDDKLASNADYVIAKTAQETIEETAARAGAMDVAQLNREIGDILEAAKFLELLDGKKVLYGRMGKHMARLAGTIIGAASGGPLSGIAGLIGGDIVARMLSSTSIASPVKRLILKNLQRTSPAAYQRTLDWLKKQGLDRELRVRLPAPSFIPMTGPKPAPTKVESLPAKRAVGVDPKTGRFKTVFTSEGQKGRSPSSIQDPTYQITKPINIVPKKDIAPSIPPKIGKVKEAGGIRVAPFASLTSTPAQETALLKSARIASGKYKVGDVYVQSVKGKERPVIISKIKPDGSVEGFYMGAISPTEKAFGIGLDSLQSGLWRNPSKELQIPSFDQQTLDVFVSRVFFKQPQPTKLPFVPAKRELEVTMTSRSGGKPFVPKKKLVRVAQFTDEGKTGKFWTTPEGADSGYGSKRKDALIDTSKLYKGSSSYDFLEKRGLMTKQLKKELEAAENSSDPNRFYKITEDRAEEILKKEGYAGAHWTSEDDLNPTQYQIWDKSVIINK